MKILILILSAALAFISCSSDESTNKSGATVNSGKLQLGEIIHDSLTTEQTDKIKRIHSVLSEVNPSTLEETMTNFRRDQFPDKEIRVWQEMADAYEKYLNTLAVPPEIHIKKEVFQLLLLRSMVAEEIALQQAQLTYLTSQEAREVVGFYTLAPEPLKVFK